MTHEETLTKIAETRKSFSRCVSLSYCGDCKAAALWLCDELEAALHRCKQMHNILINTRQQRNNVCVELCKAQAEGRKKP